jgi:esterase/lipase superfamily enzyme
MELTVYGDSGTPIIGLPTRGATCEQWEKFGMLEAITYQLEQGYNQLYCLSSVDKESFLNGQASPAQRLIRHGQYQSYLVEEVVPYVQEQNKTDFVIVAGTDLGAYHAITTALKYPKKFGKAIGMSGVYDIKHFLDGFYNDEVYYNNPVDFVPNLNNQPVLDHIRNVDIRLVSYDTDKRKEDSQRMSDVLRMKFIEHEFDVWGMEDRDEWDLWPRMLKTHII